MLTLPRRQPRPEIASSDFAEHALHGLSTTPKYLLAKYFYDRAGSALFEKITELPEYYPTRCELRILATHGPEIAKFVPANAALIEFGSGSSRKVRSLLRAARQIAAYVPVDISEAFLLEEAAALARDFPRLAIAPVTADFGQPFVLPAVAQTRPRVGFFPGSTIGNFEPAHARAFLRHAADILGTGALLIVGVDLVKDEKILHAAYNDAAGVTARFNLNLLIRMNRELGANFDLAAFEHRAFYNRERHRIEMHLVSRRSQQVNLLGHAVQFAAGESIHTESSYKHTPASFAALAAEAGWRRGAVWTDPEEYFSVHALRFGP